MSRLSPFLSAQRNTKPKPTIHDFAKALSLTKGRISQLWRDGMPRTSIAEATEWYERNITKYTSAKPGRKPHTIDNGLTKTQLECINLKLKAEALQRQKAREEGRLVETAKAKQIIAAVIDHQRKGYRMLAAVYAQRLALSAEQKKELEAEWERAEKNISKSISELADSLT